MLHEDAAFVRAIKAQQGGADDGRAWWCAPVAAVWVVMPAIVDHAHRFGGLRGEDLLEPVELRG